MPRRRPITTGMRRAPIAHPTVEMVEIPRLPRPDQFATPRARRQTPSHDRLELLPPAPMRPVVVERLPLVGVDKPLVAATAKPLVRRPRREQPATERAAPLTKRPAKPSRLPRPPRLAPIPALLTQLPSAIHPHEQPTTASADHHAISALWNRGDISAIAGESPFRQGPDTPRHLLWQHRWGFCTCGGIGRGMSGGRGSFSDLA
jgi:hypothetical protein